MAAPTLTLVNKANLRLIQGGPTVLCLNDADVCVVRAVALQEDGGILAGLQPQAGCAPPEGEMVLNAEQWDRLLSLLNFG